MNEYVNLKLATNIPVTIEFVWDDVKRWEHPEYGVSYTANVHATWTDRQGDHDEDKASIRMTPSLMDKLIGLGAGKGSVVEICKVTNDANRTEYELAHKVASSEAGFWVKDRERRTVNLDGVETGAKTVAKAAIPAAPAATEASQPKETKSAPAPTSAASPSVDASPRWEDILEQQQSLYERCLTRAQSIWTNFYGGEDKVSDDVLHATATTLVIALDRKGVRVPLTDNAKQIDFPLPEKEVEEQPKDDAPDWVTEDVPFSSEPQ